MSMRNNVSIACLEWINRCFQDKYRYKSFAMVTKSCNNYKETESLCSNLAPEDIVTFPPNSLEESGKGCSVVVKRFHKKTMSEFFNSLKEAHS